MTTVTSAAKLRLLEFLEVPVVENDIAAVLRNPRPQIWLALSGGAFLRAGGNQSTEPELTEAGSPVTVIKRGPLGSTFSGWTFAELKVAASKREVLIIL